MESFIIGFGDDDTEIGTLELCGGKGINLVRLSRAGFAVPAGFCLATTVYTAFVELNELAAPIAEATLGLDAADAEALDAASETIRQAFSAGRIPDDVRRAILDAAEGLGEGPVAVRSSATAEDLADLSFAGQQDTYLNVVGPDALLRAVVDCWGSLWTARAIGYRIRAGIAHDSVTLAVVVQRMVDARASGVMFTADPLTGRRDRIVMDATLGLGEALVSGQVTPDHAELDRQGRLLSRELGAKAAQTVTRRGGGVETVVREGAGWAVDEEELARLAELGVRVEEEHGSPQDIEWAIDAQGGLWLLQSRAITSLYPLPAASDEELAVWASFGGFQGMLKPITPLGQDALVMLARGIYQIVGLQPPGRYRIDSVPYLRVAGERLWIRLDKVLRTPVGRIVPRFMTLADPSSGAILQSLDEPALRPVPGRRASMRRLVRLAPWLVWNAGRALADPAAARRRLDRDCDRLVAATSRALDRAGHAPTASARLAARLDVMETQLTATFRMLLTRFGPIMPTSMLAIQVIRTVGGPEAMRTLRSLDGNVTTAMDLALWRVAEAVRADPAMTDAFCTSSPSELARRLTTGELSDPVRAALDDFLQQYGMRGVGEIDLGHPRFADDLAPVMASLTSYVGLDRSPAEEYARGTAESAATLAELQRSLAARGVRGRLQARLLGWLVTRVRGMFGARETPKFTIIRMFGAVREALLASGHDLAAAGLLENADDIWLLHVADLRTAFDREPAGLQALVTQRRYEQAAEARRRQIPRVMLGDGRTFYEGVADPADGSIGGSPVSPGVVEGPVRVVLAPSNAGLLPGEIMVCPGTDPAWTPLFLTAAGLVTEVGGLMTHGSVVAREYGIPAVVGVHEATTRLRTGMRIRLDGSAGHITILE